MALKPRRIPHRPVQPSHLSTMTTKVTECFQDGSCLDLFVKNGKLCIMLHITDQRTDDRVIKFMSSVPLDKVIALVTPAANA